jgi:hypothetical protein
MKQLQTQEVLKWIIACAVLSYIIFGIIKAFENLL